MNKREKVPLNLLSTGVPGLDEVLGGGLPEYSLNLVAGAPGVGKTTMIHQLIFANATPGRPALYFTVVGEPPLKMLRYQQQMDFFDPAKVGTAVRFIDLSPEATAGDLGKVLEKINRSITEHQPSIVVVDSFRSVVRSAGGDAAHPVMQDFVHQLAQILTSWQITSFLIGEYGDGETGSNALFTVADGIIWLSQSRERNSVVRKLEITKMRGMAAMAGMHTFRITERGVHVFPRSTSRPELSDRFIPKNRVGFGIPVLDEMLGGGPRQGDSTLVAGPSGTGKTVLCTQFIAAGAALNETGVLAVFEEHPIDYLHRAKDLGFDLGAVVAEGKLKVLYLRPLDLSADEILEEMQRAVAEIGATRLVIDSLNGLELSLAPSFREDFRESLYRMVGRLTGSGVSILLTVEVMESFTELRLSPQGVSFLAQNILFLRYVEISGELRRMLAVVKMRRSSHSRELREYVVAEGGLQVLGPLSGYEGLLTGVPKTGGSRPEF